MSDNGGVKPLRIVEFRAENTKRIEAIEIYPADKDVVILTGKNRQGKSSVLDAIWMALGGKKNIPGEPVKKGESEAEIHLDLGEFSVTRRIAETGDMLKVRNRNGGSVPSPQKFLDSCLTGLSGNPLEFMRMKPAKQLDMVQKMFPLQVDQKKVEKIAGVIARSVKMADDQILYLSNVRSLLYDERTEVNREIKRLQGAIESYEIPASMKNVEPLPQEKLKEELGALQKQDRENEQKKTDLRELSSSMDSLKRSIIAKEEEIRGVQEEMIRLNNKFSLLRTEREKLSEQLEIKNIEVMDKEDEIESIVPVNFDDINSRMAINQTLLSKKKSVDDLAASEEESAALTKQLADLDAYKIEVIKQAKLPLPALGFSDSSLTYNGLPLDQASGREQIEISCHMCLAQHPHIGIITVDVGWSELDSDGQQIIRDFARQTGAQIWVTKVQEVPGEGFHIVDGRLFAVDGVTIEEDINEQDAVRPGPEDGAW